jgi:hypothetical protein
MEPRQPLTRIGAIFGWIARKFAGHRPGNESSRTLPNTQVFGLSAPDGFVVLNSAADPESADSDLKPTNIPPIP